MSEQVTATAATNRQPWTMLEAEFIEWFRQNYLTYLESRRPTKNNRFWKPEFEARTQRFIGEAKRSYVEEVRAAIARGDPVPAEILAQNTAFARYGVARAAYFKGRKTSFDNVSSAIDLTLQPTFGIKVKRQDGLPISKEQIQEIETSIIEIESVVGPLREHLRKIDPTISHTNGKHPFMSDAGGVCVDEQRTIAIGVRDRAGRPIRAFAHELAHLFDMTSGRLMGEPSYSECFHDVDLLVEARRTMNGRDVEIARLLKLRYGDVRTEEDRVEIQRRRHHLGPYWRCPAEIFARLFEQFIATELHGKTTVSVEPDYTGRIGWWSSAAFEPLKARVRTQFELRMTAIEDGCA